MQSANLHQQNISVGVEHNWGITDNIKATISWLLSAIAITIATTYFFTSLYLVYPQELLKYFFVLFFLLGSISHIFIFPKWLPHLHNIGGFVFILLLSSVISIAVFLVFFVASFDGGMLPFAVGAAFMLPYTVHLCWHYYAGIDPVYSYKQWYLPAGMEPETKMSLLLNSLPLKIKIKIRETDAVEIVFNVNLIGKLELSMMFCRFLFDQKTVIETTDENGMPYAWHFYVKKWYGVKELNPDASLFKNGIKENDIVIVERVIK